MNIRRRLASAFPRRINYGLADLRGDVLGGISAGGVVLPVAMGYGVISGLGPAAGLYGAVAVGLFAALFGGVKGMIAGPSLLVSLTMAVVVAEYATSLAEAVTVGILAGLIQIAFGVLGLGRYVSYIPFSLSSGFFTAFGFLVIIRQSFLALGASSDGGGVIGSIQAWPEAIAEVNFDALALTALCLSLGILWRGRLLGLSPAHFVVLAVGTLAGALWLREAPTLGEIPRGLPTPDLSAISLGFFLGVLQPAFVMALLSSVATLMQALRLDAITGSQHRPNRQIIAQGMGNIAAGFVGGAPGSAGAASLVAAYGGARSAVAGITVVMLLLAVILALAPVAERVPFAVLAGILIKIGWDVIDWRFISRIHRVSRSYAFVMLLTCFLVLFVDLIAAILIGLVVAGLSGARRLENLEVAALISVPLLDRAVLQDADFDDETDPFQASTGLVIFPDRVTVASAREVSRIVRPDIRGQQIVVFDMSRTVYVDDSAAVIIGELIQIAMTQKSRTFIICGLTKDVDNTLNSMGLLDRVPKENFAADMEGAKQIIRPLLRGR